MTAPDSTRELDMTPERKRVNSLIVQLWGAYHDLHGRYENKALTDLDADIWFQIVKHPAIREALRPEEANK